MTQRKSAPLWVRILLIGILTLAIIPAWLYASGFLMQLLLFRGKEAPPLSWHTWLDYYQHYKHVPKVAGPLKLSGLGASLPFVAFAVLAFMKPKVSLHGDAKWAKRRDIQKAGLLEGADDGIIVGRLGKDYLTASLDKYPHVMLAAPTGSGKGVGTVLPNLFNWNHSVIVLDIKHENWALTAGWRKKHGHEVYLFDPLNPERKTHCWNPLAYINADPNLRIDDIQAIGQILFPDIDGTDPIWAASCRSLFTGVVLYLIETPGKLVTLGQVARETFGSDGKRWEKIIKGRAESGSPLSQACTSALMDFVKVSDNTQTSIRKTFTSRFDLFTNPLIDAATSRNDFDISAVRKKRISIYLGITPNTLDRLAPLLNLFFQQVVDLNTRQLPEHNPELKYQCLLLPDEFRSLGKMKVLVTAIAFLRGYGLRLLPIFQSPSQVREVYGDDAAKNFFVNHQIRIAYTPADIDAATEVSRELGNFTYKAQSKSKPMAFSKGSQSMSESDQARALLLPQEVKELGEDEVLIFAKGCPPIRAEKIRWYKDPTFKDRVLPAPELKPAPLPAVEAVESVADDEFSPVEVNDMETLYERPLEDFMNFANVEIPTGEVTEEEAEALADEMFAKLAR